MLDKLHFTFTFLASKDEQALFAATQQSYKGQSGVPLVTVIEKICSVVAFKCVWRVSDDEIEQAWNWICEKRDECDLISSKLSEVCFFFSAISTSKLYSKKKKAGTSEEASDELNDESTINPSQI